MMKYAFFHIPAFDPTAAQAELNHFLARHRIRDVSREFVSHGERSAWCVCVQYDEVSSGGARTPESTGKPPRIDYREVLTPEQFAIFSPLRKLRNELAEAAGIPAYSVFSNEQLATMVRRRVRTLGELREIEGIGARRSEQYGEAALSLLRDLQGGDSDPGASGDGTNGDDTNGDDANTVRDASRYMDDTVVWADSREAATTLAREYRDLLGDTLRLTLKPVIVQRSARGLTFCGSRIEPGRVRPGRRRQRRFKERLRVWERAWSEGLIDTPTLQGRVDALVAMLGPEQSGTRSLAWRRDWLRERRGLASAWPQLIGVDPRLTSARSGPASRGVGEAEGPAG